MATTMKNSMIVVAVVAMLALAIVPVCTDDTDAAEKSTVTKTISFKIVGNDKYVNDNTTMVHFVVEYEYKPYDDSDSKLEIKYRGEAVDENGKIVTTVDGSRTVSGTGKITDGPTALAKDVFAHSSGTAKMSITATGAGELKASVTMYVGDDVYDKQTFDESVGSYDSESGSLLPIVAIIVIIVVVIAVIGFVYSRR